MINFNFFILNDYLGIFILLNISIIIACFLIFISYVLVIQLPDSEKLSTYECGYEPYDNARHVFNINFCIIGLFFLIFDVEILFLLPWCLSVADLNLLGLWSVIDFIFELFIGYFYIWYSNSLINN